HRKAPRPERGNAWRTHKALPLPGFGLDVQGSKPGVQLWDTNGSTVPTATPGDVEGKSWRVRELRLSVVRELLLASAFRLGLIESHQSTATCGAARPFGYCPFGRGPSPVSLEASSAPGRASGPSFGRRRPPVR